MLTSKLWNKETIKAKEKNKFKYIDRNLKKDITQQFIQIKNEENYKQTVQLTTDIELSLLAKTVMLSNKDAVLLEGRPLGQVVNIRT